MEKKKTRKKCIKTETTRIPFNQKQKIEFIGDGDFRQGLTKVLTIYENTTAHPEQILMSDVDKLMSDLKTYYSDNHYNHFTNFPACFKLFLKKGFVNTDILKTRPEHNIEKFEKKEIENAD